MLQAQFKFWRRHPPMYRLMASYVGFKPETETELSDEQPADLSVMARMLNDFKDQIPAHLRRVTDTYTPISSEADSHGERQD